MKTYTISTKVEIDQDTLDGIIDSAINWCSYWCDELSQGRQHTEKLPYNALSEMVTRGGTLVFKIDEPFEESGKTRFVLTEKKMLKGLVAYAKKHNEFDFEDYDGPMSDAALQMALFGEVVFV